MDSDFEKALISFTKHLPALGAEVREAVAVAHAKQRAFDDACSACLGALLTLFRAENSQEDPFLVFPPHIRTWNPDLDAAKVDGLLIQHLLLERLLRCVFPDALRYNAMARQVALVLDVLGTSGFDRSGFLSSLDVYYRPVERAFRQCTTRGDQQQLLSAFCEAFINAYDREQAEAFSVIYTPQEVVRFQCESVEQKLREVFGASLSSPGVPILDPAAGVGSYLIYVLGRIGREMLPYKYRRELFAIEIMLVPSFIARLNIEQAFVNLVGWYAPFPGLRYADALS